MTDTEIVRSNWSFLMEWWCYPTTTDPDTIVRHIMNYCGLNLAPALVADRLYGGFQCAHKDQGATRVHACFNTGQYTYLGKNVPLTPEQREQTWRELIETNGVDFWAARGPFLDGAEKVMPGAFERIGP